MKHTPTFGNSQPEAKLLENGLHKVLGYILG
jgi:hypothetical protein